MQKYLILLFLCCYGKMFGQGNFDYSQVKVLDVDWQAADPTCSSPFCKIDIKKDDFPHYA